jgi:hypothetical protein
MSQENLRAVLNYVKDVLGVQAFVPEAGSINVKPVAAKSSPYIFVGAYGADPSLLEMQNRMVSALKLQASDFQFANLEQTNVQSEWFASALVIVVFGERAASQLPAHLGLATLKAGEVKQTSGQKLLLTHSLTDLANSAALKKETWTHLQSVF